MNFIPDAQIQVDGDDTYIVLESVGRVQVPPLFAERARAAAGRNLTFGIRPVHLEDARFVPSDRTAQSAIDAVVDVVENLGNELQVYLTTGDRNIIATLNPRSAVVPGSKVRLYVDSDQIHLFDTDTTAAIF